MRPVRLQAFVEIIHVFLGWIHDPVTLIEEGYGDQLARVKGRREGAKSHHRPTQPLPVGGVGTILQRGGFGPSVDTLDRKGEDGQRTYPFVLVPSEVRL